MKLHELINETTTTGAVAVGAVAPIGKTIKREQEDVSDLGGMRVWEVYIDNHYFDGTGIDYGSRPYPVVAASADDAKQLVLDNADEVLEDILSKKFASGNPILPKETAVEITQKQIDRVDDSSSTHMRTTFVPETVLTPEGFKAVVIDGGVVSEVADVINESFRRLDTVRIKSSNIQGTIHGILGESVVVKTENERIKVHMNDIESLYENTSELRLSDVAKIKTNFEDADFWIQRKGSNQTVGTPTREFSPEHIGVKVTHDDIVVPNYLFYAIQYLHSKGYFRQYAVGITNLKNIRAEDVKNIRFSKQNVNENLRDWFGKGKKGGAGGGGWDRYNTKGERIGKCGDAADSEGKPKCLSKSKAASLRASGGKKAIAAAVNKKRREDPNKDRSGKAKNVSSTTKESVNEYTKIPFEQCPGCGGSIVHISEAEGKKDACYHKVKSRYKVWPSAYASGALVQCRKKGAKNWGNKTKEGVGENTRTKTQSDLGLDDLLNPRTDTLPAKSDVSSGSPEVVSVKKATASDTAKAMQDISPTNQMRDLLNRMRDIEMDDDDLDVGYVQEPVPVTTDNLPAVISKELKTDGVQSPNFHQVSVLPGNMNRAIRQLGKKIFSTVTKTPTEDIYMIGDLSGMGPNSHEEVNAVAGWITSNGVPVTGLSEIDFSGIFPGYDADYQMYSAGGVRWVLIQDYIDGEYMGKYIFMWPEHDSLDVWNKKHLDKDPHGILESVQISKRTLFGVSFLGMSQFLKEQNMVDGSIPLPSQKEITLHGDQFFEKFGWIEIPNHLTEAEYQGRKVTLNKPIRSTDGPKKFHVYVKNDKGNVIKVNFGDPDMKIKKSDPERRKSFRARHKCDQKKDKTTAGYWSCKMW